ncbi:MAG: SMP-30/gluconolactonase/LRE family protein [Acidimicrobiales bacterium]
MVALFTHLHSTHPEITSLPQPPKASPEAQVPVIACDALFSFEGRPGGVAVGPDKSIYISDSDASTIWRVAPDGEAERFFTLQRPGPGSDRAGPFGPAGLASRSDGSLVVADPRHHRISLVDTDRSVRVLAGGANGFREGLGNQAMFRLPMDVAVGADGTIFVADTGNHRIRVISPEGTVATLAGSIYDYGDGRGAHGRFRLPGALDVDAAGICYVADTGNNAVRRVAPDGGVTTLAGGPPGGDRDGTGPAVGLHWPGGVAATADGSVWVADFGNGSLRHITAAGETATVFKIAGVGYPTAVATLPDGAVVVAGFSPSGLDSHTGCVMIHHDGG